MRNNKIEKQTNKKRVDNQQACLIKTLLGLIQAEMNGQQKKFEATLKQTIKTLKKKNLKSLNHRL